MDGQAAITFDRVTKRYPGTIILDEVSATVARGRITVLLGSNGAGKTTLMRLVSGLAHPTSGHVSVAGLPPQSRAGQVGILFEDPHLYPHLSGWQNLRILSGRARDDRLAELLRVAGLDQHLLKRKARGYSFGQRRRLTLAALAHGPSDILLLDEPTNGLDPDGVAAFVTLARRLAQEGRTLFITGQDLGALTQLAQDVYTLRSGRLEREDDWGRGSVEGVLEIQTPDAEALLAALAPLDEHGLTLTRQAGSVVLRGGQEQLRRLLSAASALPPSLASGVALRETELRDVWKVR